MSTPQYFNPNALGIRSVPGATNMPGLRRTNEEFEPFESYTNFFAEEVPEVVSIAVGPDQAYRPPTTTHRNVSFSVEAANNQKEKTRPKSNTSNVSARRLQQNHSVYAGQTPPRKHVEVLCQYSTSGCQEMVQKGTQAEQDHYMNCDFRPIPCLLEAVCTEVLPYHNFLFHLTKHAQPIFSKHLHTRLYIWAEDFFHDQKWYPKWLQADGKHFFLMMHRKTPGIWISWVWMLGSRDEAKAYKSKLFYYKGLRSVGSTFGVHSIRETTEEIEASKDCLLLTDQAMLSLSQIGEKVITDFSISLLIIDGDTTPLPGSISRMQGVQNRDGSDGVYSAQSHSTVVTHRADRYHATASPSSVSVSGLVSRTPLTENGSVMRMLGGQDNRGPVEFEGGIIEEFFKLFTSTATLRAFDSNVSTTATEFGDLDQEFSYSTQHDNAVD